MADETMQKIIMNKHPDTSKEGKFIKIIIISNIILIYITSGWPSNK